MDCSIIIRTLNEEIYLDQLIEKIKSQNLNSKLKYEIILVDSGSTDNTLKIAERHKINIIKIKKEEFSFGRSLNYGCKFANGKMLVFISGHCVPLNDNWLINLCEPLIKNKAVYVYGRQVAGKETKFSEHVHFNKFFPEQITVNKELNEDHQSDFVDHHSEFFCNNANAALLKETWERFKFDENIVALEDIMLAKKIKDNNGTILYAPNSEVIHHHNENFLKIKNRYEREGLALNLIINQINFSFVDFLRLFFLNIIFDFKEAFKKKIFLKHFISILYFRLAMSLGIYLGNLRYKNKNNDFKEIYYFPK